MSTETRQLIWWPKRDLIQSSKQECFVLSQDINAQPAWPIKTHNLYHKVFTERQLCNINLGIIPLSYTILPVFYNKNHDVYSKNYVRVGQISGKFLEIWSIWATWSRGSSTILWRLQACKVSPWRRMQVSRYGEVKFIQRYQQIDSIARKPGSGCPYRKCYYVLHVRNLGDFAIFKLI